VGDGIEGKFLEQVKMWMKIVIESKEHTSKQRNSQISKGLNASCFPMISAYFPPLVAHRRASTIYTTPLQNNLPKQDYFFTCKYTHYSLQHHAQVFKAGSEFTSHSFHSSPRD
jgi:hypothetical protein